MHLVVRMVIKCDEHQHLTRRPQKVVKLKIGRRNEVGLQFPTVCDSELIEMAGK